LRLLTTPILLFMIAQTWDESISGQVAPSRASIYEAFFTEIARGKHRFDTARNEPVARAAELLRDRLVETGEIAEQAEPHQAMLWLLSRVAWEERRLSRRGETLTRRHVSNLLHEELALNGDMAGVVEIGLLLALQADLRAERPQILFGHKSFREFSTARWWADRLHKIAQARDRDRKQYERTLYGARLLDHEDASFRFLVEMLGTDQARPGGSPPPWSTDLREKLVAWAEDCFNDEDQEFAEDKKSGARTAMRLDMRAMLREAALAIGSATPGSRGIAISNPKALRSLLAWFFGVEEPAIIVARGAKLENTALAGVRLIEADLRGAHLQSANLQEAYLRDVNLQEANLQGANLHGTDMWFANLRGADLRNAELEFADLNGADLRNAKLEGANLQHANLQDVNLKGANLQGANLDNAKLHGAKLEGADLRKANLSGASLQLGAGLEPAADLRHANLEGANLQYADLQGANLKGANLRHATYNDYTRWPEGFPVAAVGAYHVSHE
jgi:uncharacterized protein YjbI with pentapeptide repeats